ncbi:MAG: hypothetical protein IKE43_01365 [Coriobacteriales bacterium]|nr:hypothetical protein [Coriobacteriales bacterium]
MKEYITKSGAVLTDEDFDRLADEAELGNYPGKPGAWIIRPQGRPSLSDEELVTITFKVPRSQRDAVDREALIHNETRSQFMRRTLEAALA